MEQQRIEKEKEIARLRAQQERAKDKQAEKVTFRVACEHGVLSIESVHVAMYAAVMNVELHLCILLLCM